MKYVLDASAAIAFLRGEPGAVNVRNILIDTANEIHIHAANAIEVQYRITSYGGDLAAIEAIQDLTAIGVKIFEPLSAALRPRVCFFKTRYPFLSLADSICIALGEYMKCAVVTCDRPFANVKDGIKFEFIR